MSSNDWLSVAQLFCSCVWLLFLMHCTLAPFLFQATLCVDMLP